MSTESQILANRQNAQHSTGAKTEAGKAASCMNNFRHGLAGAFNVLPSEDQDEFDALVCGLKADHQPSTLTETLLVQRMAQSYWLSKRALYLQDQCCTDEELSLDEQRRQFALFLRYQTTNDRAFHRALNDLLKLKAERRRQEIGFESQQQKKAQESRREAAEKRRVDEAALRQRAEDRKRELHEFAVLLAEAKVDHQYVLTSNAKLDGIIASTRQNIPLEAKQTA
jgi:hypothetical protein